MKNIAQFDCYRDYVEYLGIKGIIFTRNQWRKLHQKYKKCDIKPTKNK